MTQDNNEGGIFTVFNDGRFDISFGIKMMMEIYAIEIIFKSHEPFQSYQLTSPANSARKAG